MNIIGFTGLKQSGKSTAADYLVAEHGFELVSFAALLKQSVANLFGIPLELIEELKNDGEAVIRVDVGGGRYKTITWRNFLQRYGTEAHRDVFGQNFWVDFVAFPEKAVCADVRFENEAAAIRQAGGRVIRIERSEVANSGDTHASEAGVEPDGTIVNDGSVDDLLDFVDALVAFPALSLGATIQTPQGEEE